MSDTNLHILNGRLCDAPKYKLLGSGNISVNFRIATTSNYKDKAGEWKQRDEFHNVSTYISKANQAYWLARCLKGKRMQIVGERRTEKVVNPDGTASYYSFTAAKQQDCTLPDLVQQPIADLAPQADTRAPAPLYLNVPNAPTPRNDNNDLAFEEYANFNQ